MSDQKMYGDLFRHIGSLELEDGQLRLGLQDFLTIDPHGQDPVLVNRSAPQENKKGKKMNDTSGQHGSTSSASASQILYFMNKLHRQLGMDGLMEYLTILKV